MKTHQRMDGLPLAGGANRDADPQDARRRRPGCAGRRSGRGRMDAIDYGRAGDTENPSSKLAAR